jgi:ABC-2 type transport system permease protein
MAFFAVIEKEFRMFFRYPLRVVSSLLVGLVFLLQFVYFGEAVLGGRYSSLLAQSTGIGDYPTYALIGYVLWWVSVSPMEAGVWGIRRELQRGTFESNVASPFPLLGMVISLSLSWMLMDSVIMFLVFLLGCVLFGVSLEVFAVLKAFPVILLSFLAFLGFGLIFAGLVIVLKNIGLFAQIFEFLILFISGVFFPLKTLPEWITAVSLVVPLTHSAAALRLLLAGRSYSAVAQSVTVLSVLVVVYWALGLSVFKWAEKTAGVVGYGAY